jgi:hypothetical protein
MPGKLKLPFFVFFPKGLVKVDKKLTYLTFFLVNLLRFQRFGRTFAIPF